MLMEITSELKSITSGIYAFQFLLLTVMLEPMEILIMHAVLLSFFSNLNRVKQPFKLE